MSVTLKISINLNIVFCLVCKHWLIDLEGRVFANGLGDLGSVPGHVIPKTLKWYLIPPCLALSNIRYVSRVKWSNPGKGVAPSPTPRCSSYWKGAFWSPSTTVANFTYYFILHPQLEEWHVNLIIKEAPVV